MRIGLRTLIVVLTVVLFATPAFAGGEQEQEDDTIHIALSAPITGDWSEFGVNFERSVKLAIEELNEEGGILGRQVRLSVGDTKGNPQEAATLAQRWTDDPTVVAQIGPFASGPSIAAQPIYDSAGMVQLSPTASHTDYAGGSPWSFGIVGTQAGEGPFNARYAYEEIGIREIAVLYLNNDWGIDTAEYFSEAFEELGGDVVATESYFDGESDFTAALSSLRDSDADGLFIASFYNDGAAINIQKDRLGWDVPVLGPTSLYSPQLIELGGDAVEGLYTGTGFFTPDPDPQVRRYVEAFEEAYDALPNFHAALAYDSMMLLADAIERAGTTESEAIRDALAETEDFPGLTGDITFTPKGDAVKSYRMLTIRDGEFVLYDE
ncbi:MAG: ABC transporter substrate-binding protein [Alkalispirochaetaceae bacterium]